MTVTPCVVRMLIASILDREDLPSDVKERISRGVALEVAKYMNTTNHKIQVSLGEVAFALESARQEMDVRLWSCIDALEQSDAASKVEKGNP